ncbi:DUF1878 domain-containing protein [Faecalicatena contorta]|uniref:DUF1878 domain-containing protein n=1 Tax=Faecalicatena contorta TaxID=39482 RepID=UPI00189AA79A|nr:DUF1878 domain-containing protein [Faecalicatena contorta]
MGNISKTFKEYKVTKTEQTKIMDVMDKYRDKIANRLEVSNAEFENDIISIFGGDIQAMRHSPAIEYHFCEYVAKDFMEDGRWEEVFPALYGKFVKYGGKIKE